MRTHKMLTCKHFIPSLVYLNDKKPAEYISTIWNPKGISPPNGFMFRVCTLFRRLDRLDTLLLSYIQQHRETSVR